MIGEITTAPTTPAIGVTFQTRDSDSNNSPISILLLQGVQETSQWRPLANFWPIAPETVPEYQD